MARTRDRGSKLRLIHVVDAAVSEQAKACIDFLETLPGSYDVEQVRVDTGSVRPLLESGSVLLVHQKCSWNLVHRLWRWRLAAPVVLVEHHHSARFLSENASAAWRTRLLLRAAYACADRVVAVSEAQSRWMLEEALISSQKLHRIPPIGNLSRFLDLPQPTKDAQKPVLGAYGPWDHQAGLDLLVRALHRVPDEPMEIFLGGSGSAEARALAGQDPRIRWCGEQVGSRDLIAKCSLILVPSRWEPFGRIAAEAKAAARPIIVHAVDGLTEQARDCGLAIPSEPGVLAAALVSLAHLPLDSWSAACRKSACVLAEEASREWQTLLSSLHPNARRSPGPLGESGFERSGVEEIPAGLARTT